MSVRSLSSQKALSMLRRSRPDFFGDSVERNGLPDCETPPPPRACDAQPQVQIWRQIGDRRRLIIWRYLRLDRTDDALRLDLICKKSQR